MPINCHKHKLSIFLSPDVAVAVAVAVGAEGILKFKYKIKCPIEIAYNEHPRQTVFHLCDNGSRQAGGWTQPRQLKDGQRKESDKRGGVGEG